MKKFFRREAVVIEETPIVTDLNGCARCHGPGHPGLEFKKLTHDMMTPRGIVFTHWAPCPTNGEPIMYATVSVDEAKPE